MSIYANGVIDPFVGVLMVLAVARTTRLIVADEITAALRARATGWQKTLVNCSWCVSIWVSLIIVPTGFFFGKNWWWQCGAFILFASYFTGLFSRFETQQPKTTRIEFFPVSPLTHQKLPDIDYGVTTVNSTETDDTSQQDA